MGQSLTTQLHWKARHHSTVMPLQPKVAPPRSFLCNFLMAVGRSCSLKNTAAALARGSLACFVLPRSSSKNQRRHNLWNPNLNDESKETETGGTKETLIQRTPRTTRNQRNPNLKRTKKSLIYGTQTRTTNSRNKDGRYPKKPFDLILMEITHAMPVLLGVLLSFLDAMTVILGILMSRTDTMPALLG